MSAQPAFYATVRQKAARRWDQLEQDRELTGSWYQLFKRVQSLRRKRHTSSECIRRQ